MGRYCALTAATGYLSAYSTLDTARKALAEQEADTEVDRLLDGFDTDLWSAATTPKEVREAADKLAAARYVRLSLAAVTSSLAPPEGSLTGTLEDEARGTLAGIGTRGWYRADDGTRVLRRDKTRGPRFGEIAR